MPTESGASDQPYRDPFRSHDDSLSSALRHQTLRAGWFMGSLISHLLIFLLLILLIPPSPPTTKPPRITIIIGTDETLDDDTVDLTPPAPTTAEPASEHPNEIVSPDVVVSFSPDTPAITIDTGTADHEPDATPSISLSDGVIADADFSALSVTSGINSLDAGNRLAFSRSPQERRRNTYERGGDDRTLLACEEGLRWLARHQESDGSWDPQKYGCHPALRAGMTGVALLAFAGGGNSPEVGEFKNNVVRASQWLIKHQQPDGRIGLHSEVGVVLMALSETYAMSSDRRRHVQLRGAVEKLGRYAEKTQFNCGGWDYFPEPWQANQLVSGWYVLGLKSARIAEINIPTDVYEKAFSFYRNGTTNNGFTFDSLRINADTRPDEILSHWGVRGAMPLTCLLFLGMPTTDPKIEGCAKQSVSRLPSTTSVQEMDYSYVYYQGLGLILMGAKSNYWQSFNAPMKETILSLQVKSGFYSDNRGSWPPSKRDPMGWGRVGSTAFGTMIMQLYFVYNGVR